MNVTPAYYLCSTGFCNCRVEFYHVCGANNKKNRLIKLVQKG